jgi:hypothetical protein
MELNPQTVIDEMLRKINALTAENIILSSQVKALSEKLSGYEDASPTAVMNGTVDSEGKYDKEITEGKIGPND